MKDKVAQRIADVLLSVQRCFSAFMNERLDKLSRRGKQVCLILFCLVFGGLSIQALTGVIRDHVHFSRHIKPARFSVPKYINGTGTEISQPTVTDIDISRINIFKRRMDSLKVSGRGRNIYERILRSRPGLMDSIKAMEQLHSSQIK